MDNPSIGSILGLISVSTLLIGYGMAIYVFILFVKVAKRVIRVCDMYLEEKVTQKKAD